MVNPSHSLITLSEVSKGKNKDSESATIYNYLLDNALDAPSKNQLKLF